MHLISTPFSTSYISYTKRGRNVIYLQFPLHILVFKQVEGKSYGQGSLGLLGVNKR